MEQPYLPVDNSPYKFKLSALLIVLLFPLLLSAQTNYTPLKDHPDSTTKLQKPDTARKRFGRAALFFGIVEVAPWVYDRYVVNQAYAHITFSRFAHNLDPRTFGFDQDPFQTNQFGHPYHGSFFYNSFRVNGYSFWQSAPAALAGSYVWETAAENNNPATHDLINTAFGGVILGEMEYRFANKVINNQATGFKRQVSEVGGFILDPLNGLNRIIDGKWGKLAPNNVLHDSSKISAEFDLGVRRIGNFSGSNAGWYGHVGLLYGDPEEDYNTPFSNIRINAEFGKDDSAKVNIISVYGSLAGWQIRSTEKNVQLALLSANYDFIRNKQFFYGGQSVKINLFSEYDISRKFKVNTLFGAGAVILGATPDPYIYHTRNYDYGMGVNYSAMGSISYDNRLFYNISYRGGVLATIDGNSSHNVVGAFTTELSYMFVKGFSLAAEPGYYTFHSYYDHNPDVLRNYPYVRFSARYTVTF